MPKIIATQDLDLSPDQVERLQSLGDVTIHNDLAENYDAARSGASVAALYECS